MSFACPRRHQSYASFRLEIFESLFGSVSARHARKHFPSPRSRVQRGQVQHRCFQSSAKLSKQRGSRNIKEDAELLAFLEAKRVNDEEQSYSLSVRNDDSTVREPDKLNIEEGSPPSPNGNEQGRKDWTCASCGFSNFRRRTTCAQCSQRPSGSVAAPPTSEYWSSSIGQRHKDESRQWSPYSQRGQEDLKNLVQDLKNAASDAAKFEEEYHAIPTQDVKRLTLDPHQSPIFLVKGTNHIRLASEEEPSISIKRLSLDLPESPVMRRLRRKKLHKRAPTDEETSALSNNPWASILASPVRLCQGTGVRLPRDLLVQWNFVKRRGNDATYLVPSALANIKTLTSPGYVEKVFRPTEDSWDIEGDDGSEVMETSSESKILTSSNPEFHAQKLWQKSTEHAGKTTILPYQPLIEQLTTRMIRRDNGATVKGAVQRILTHRIKAAFKEAQHYAKDSKDRSAMDLNFLQWQPDIASRMTNIMQERVLTALESLGILNKNEVGPETTIVPVPLKALETGRLVVTLGKHEGAEVLKYTFKAGAAEPEPSLRIPHQKLRKVLFDEFAGSFLLHVNAEKAMIPDQPSPFLSAQTPNMLPQSISLNNTLRLPVFNLQQLLGYHNGTTTRHMALRYKQVLRSSKVLDVPKPIFDPILRHSKPPAGKGVEPLTQDPQDSKNEPAYLLFVSGGAPKAQTLAKELWQLWRYQGGDQLKEETAVTSGVLRALEQSVEMSEAEAEDLE